MHIHRIFLYKQKIVLLSYLQAAEKKRKFQR